MDRRTCRGKDKYTGSGFFDVVFDVEEMPTVDAVEVVRCKDCIAHNLCKFEQYQGLDGFCSYGERKCNGK